MPPIGASIGPYTVTGELGRGGMGVVYRATDPRLGRDVAIKALPEDVAADPARLARFDREAKTLASLNHPNLAGIYGIEEHAGRRYLVLELVEGQTLSDLLEPGPVPHDEALRYALQICAGLSAAHEAGVVHRDLKPDNVKITPEGRVKILDFGLAKADEHTSTGSAMSLTPTATSPHASPTVPGAVMGTAPYMSPEQARGRSVDRRTDVWSFGVVLYEMLTGVSPFKGDTATDSIGAILHKDVDFALLPASTPPAIRRVLERCLERDKDRRYRDLADVAIELQRDDAQPAASTQRRSPATGALAVACLALLAIVAFGAYKLRTENAPRALVASFSTPVGIEFDLDGSGPGVPRLSPDGSMLAFTGRDRRRTTRLYIRDLRTGETRALPGTEDAQYPFWSPDSRFVGFFSDALYRSSVAGGPPRKISDAGNGKGGTWNQDGRIVFAPAPTGPLVTVSAEGGTPEPLTDFDSAKGDYSHRHPYFLPGGRAVLYTRRNDQSMRNTERPQIWACTLDRSVNKRLFESDANAVFADGYVYYVFDGALLARPFDPKKLEPTGEPVVIAEGVLVVDGARLAVFDATAGGAVVYLQTESSTNNQRLLYRDRTGKELETVLPSVETDAFRLTDAGRKLLINYSSNDLSGKQTRLLDLETGDARVIETDSPASNLPAITRDGSTICDFARELPDSVYYLQPTSGFTGPREIARLPITAAPANFTADNSAVLLVSFTDLESNPQVISIPVAGGEPEKIVFPGVEATFAVEPSPDGKWYAVGGAYRNEGSLFLADAADPRLCRRIPTPVAVSTPKWNADSTELFLHGVDGYIYSVPIRTLEDGTPDVGRPTALFDTQSSPTWGGIFDVDPSGEKFLVTESLNPTLTQSITYMTDWRRSVKR